MKWKFVVGLSAILMWVCASYLWSHEKHMDPQQAKAGTSIAVPDQKAPSQWEQLGPEVKVLRLWKLGGPEWPQIAVLDLSREQFNDLQKNLSAFANKYHIFPNDVRPGGRLVMLETPPKGYAGPWMAILSHKKPSYGTGASYLAEGIPLEASKDPNPASSGPQ
jgi:hypothetical protein